MPYRCRQMDDTFFTHRIVTDILDIIAFAHDGRNAGVFLRVYYKMGGGITKKAAEYACERSRASGDTILEELLRFPLLSQYARDSVTALTSQLPRLLADPAARGLDRIWQSLRYKDYVDQQQLDANKFEILRLLAEREPDLDAFLLRLDDLRALAAAPPAGDGLILSTVHSSKGLEYDTVYLLDVLDGILPAVTEPKGPEEQGQYQEERRLFYVAMTRAQNHLYLFSCRDRDSVFIRELRQALPVEGREKDDVFSALPVELCGRHYHHAQKGRGAIRASCEGQCLITYPGGETELLTLGQMYEQRKQVRKLPAKPAVPAAIPQAGRPAPKRTPANALPPEREAALAAEAVPGQKIIHSIFGEGLVTGYQDPIVTIRFPKLGEKKFVFRDSIRRGLLRFGEDDPA